VTRPDPAVTTLTYINPSAPPCAPPTYDGVTWDALVPATLDLADRARLAVNALTEPLDPEVDYELYWAVDLLARTPVMYHQPADIVQDKFFGALPMMRTASGSTQNLDVEHFLMQVYLRKQGPDGLVYIPIPGRPWGMPADPQPWDAIDRVPEGDFWSPLHMTGRVLGAYTIYALKDPTGPWAAAAAALVDGFRTVTIDSGRSGYFFAMSTEPGRDVIAPEQPPRGQRAATQGWAVQELAQCGRLLRIDRATELAHRLSRYTMLEAGYFGPDGAFTYEWPGTADRSIHFHSHTLQIVAALMVVRSIGDEELLERAVTAYDWAKEQGEPTVGFFPEWLSYRVDNFGVGPNSSEICEVADMVTAAVLLCRLGIDRWDDVDRWVRNMLAEGQLTDVEWLYDGHLVGLDRGRRDGDPAASTDRVPERVIGSFAGWPNVNDFVMDEKRHACPVRRVGRHRRSRRRSAPRQPAAQPCVRVGRHRQPPAVPGTRRHHDEAADAGLGPPPRVGRARRRGGVGRRRRASRGGRRSLPRRRRGRRRRTDRRAVPGASGLGADRDREAPVHDRPPRQ
jgi:hypothetical protein